MIVYRDIVPVVSAHSELPATENSGDYYDIDLNLVADESKLITEKTYYFKTSDDFIVDPESPSGIVLSPSTYYHITFGPGGGGVTFYDYTEITQEEAEAHTIEVEIFDIKEATYTGKDMGERKITATVKWPSPIDFQIGDYVRLEIADLVRIQGESDGGYFEEKFYIYTMPTVKKVASSQSVGDAFEHTVTFFPRQYELGTVIMRDLIQEQTASQMIYTGYDEFSFVGGAKRLLDRIMAVLKARFPEQGVAGVDYWTYDIANEINEEKNNALEQFQFDFSSNTVLDALVKLTEEGQIDTTFFINERKIYVGYKCPMICSFDDHAVIQPTPFIFHYGKTSHKPINDNNGGGLFTITKSVGTASPITRLFAYGDTRNLNRFYCSDRLVSGRYINRLMLPSFDADGMTDYIDSPSGIAKFGIREGKKTFDEIYPSLRYVTYGDLRQIKYVIKLLTSEYDATYGPLCRVQCYRVDASSTTGVNKLTEAYPDKPLCVCIHANGKVCKVILGTSQANQTSIEGSQNYLPKRNASTYIAGACYCVHQGTEYSGSSVSVQRFANYGGYKAKALTTRSQWFANINASGLTDNQREDLSTFQVNYGDDARITDVYVCEYASGAPLYDAQTQFTRDGYSAYCWPRINDLYTASQGDSIRVNEVLSVQSILKQDTDWDVSGQPFDIYLRDVGFTINEQTPMGTMVHIVGQTFNLQFLDGYLAGITFEVAEKKINGSRELDSICCLYDDNGNINSNFVSGADDPAIAQDAISKGAIWRIAVKRNDSDWESNGIILPNTVVQAHAGDHLVFLNIYMPDIYIHSAENRLLKEAQNYLNDNDNGDVSYNIDFDQIRLTQIPKLGLQMREGAIMRIVDEDLQIQTEKEARYLFKNTDGLVSKASFVEYVEEFEYIKDYYHDIITSGDVEVTENNNGTWSIFINIESIDDAELLPESQSPITLTVIQHFLDEEDVITIVQPKSYVFLGWSGDTIIAIIPKPTDIRDTCKDDTFIDTEFEATVNYTIDTGIIAPSKYVPINKVINCAANPILDFQAGHYYEVVLDYDTNIQLVTDSDNNGFVRHFCFASSLDTNFTNLYYPEYGTPTNINGAPSGYQRRKYCFYLPEAFNEAVSYYIALRYISEAGTPDYATVRLISVYESNTDDQGEELNYVDLTMDEVTIKISSSGREYSLGSTSSSNSSSSNSSSRGSVADDKKITANVRQKQRATAWQNMSAQVKSNAILSEQTEVTAATLAQNARRNFRNLDALRNSIFDPDGNITDAFLQTMMLQVGADSMNYSLDKTRIFNGTMTNISFEYESEEDMWCLNFINEDVLRHFVYTNPIDTWQVEDSGDIYLDTDKTYYIAIKAARANNYAIWAVSETQHKVDEDANYWYFNYGVVLPGTTSARTIMETRGNAYMYGDNVIAGKLSTIDGNSYFDLTGGKFKLGNELTYQNGTLTIGSVTDTSNPNSLASLLADLQDEVDGVIDTWFYEGVPTASNLPASQWTTTQDKEDHVGDLYYDKQTGYAYRYERDESTTPISYQWWLIPDTGVAQALAAAQHAQETADGRVRAFYTTPTPPYAKGDIWIQGDKGEVLYSNVKRSTGSYVAADWVSASKYVENLEYGGENVAFVNDIAETMGWPDTGTTIRIELTYYSEENSQTQHTLLPAGKYVFSANDVEVDTDYNIDLELSAINSNGDTNASVYISTGDVRNLKIVTTEPCYFRIDAHFVGPSSESYYGQIELHDIQLQAGEKGTSFQSYVKHLASSIKGSTEIAGGLLMTNVLMLKNESNAVTAGMSGLVGTTQNPEKVLMWGGGDYDAAKAAANGGAKLPVLITKSGVDSNIGCFNVEDKDTIQVDAGDNKIVISTKTMEQLGIISQQTYRGGVSFDDIAETTTVPTKTVTNQVLSTIFSASGVPSGKYRFIVPNINVSAYTNANPVASASASCDFYIRVVNNQTIHNLGNQSISTIETETSDSSKSVQKVISASTNEIDIDAGTLAVQLYGSYTLTTSESGGSAIANIGANSSAQIKALGLNKVTVIAQNGIAIISNSDSQFMVMNDDTNGKLEVIAKGLPEGTDPHVAGQLWIGANNVMMVSGG